MNNVYFEKVAEIGRLYLDYIFYEFETEPILFSCVDEQKNLFLCLCSDIRYGQRWIIAKCPLNMLKALIEEQVDIASVFLSSSTVTVVDMDLDGNENSYETSIDQIDLLDLPKEGVFIRCDKAKAMDYLWNKELTDLSAQFKSVMDVTSPFEKIVKSYTAVLSKKISLLCNQGRIYSNSEGKDFIEQLDGSANKMPYQSMTSKYQYSIHTKDKYLTITDHINSTDHDDYIHAA